MSRRSAPPTCTAADEELPAEAPHPYADGPLITTTAGVAPPGPAAERKPSGRPEVPRDRLDQLSPGV
ncbi:hypothetical protein [Streptomyces enissocaesilis]|uniref:Uncharacterized protein n=1 Tax=Streptomyces enissocaesilis TaxID=332589 RepID=A0ABP6J5X0_9ACTN